jgi:hypothetical protein
MVLDYEKFHDVVPDEPAETRSDTKVVALNQENARRAQ